MPSTAGFRLILGDPCRIAGKILMDQPHASIIGMAGARSIGSQSESFGIRSHGRPRMIISERIQMLSLIGMPT